MDAKDWGEILAAMLVAATNVAVRDVVEKAGPYTRHDGAFRWLDDRISGQRLRPMSGGTRLPRQQLAVLRMRNCCRLLPWHCAPGFSDLK